MLTNAQTFIDTPYTAHTLEMDDEEDLIINCDEVDCTTLVEYVLAMSLCPTQGKDMREGERLTDTLHVYTTLPIG